MLTSKIEPFPKKNVEEIVRRSTLFSGLSDETTRHIAAQCTLSSHRRDEIIFAEGDANDGLYIIGSGDVAVVKVMGLGERELRRLTAGEHFGEMALITSAHRNATVRALTEVHCIRMDDAGFQVLMDDDARIAQRVLRVVSERLKYSDEMSTRDVLRAHQALIFSLAKLADSRDPETGAHLYRVRDYCSLLSEILADHPKFSRHITPSFIEGMYLVSPLHDIGKVAIPDGILLKQGKLTDAEFQIMSTHTIIGAEALDTVLQYCDFEAFHLARRIILYHHERYDGTGYPHRIKGEDIPIEARIMSLADIYDALLSKRVYKPPFGYPEATERIANEAGKHFDPIMTEIMMANIGRFEKIHQKYQEEEAPSW